MRRLKFGLTLIILAQLGCLSTAGPASPSPTAETPPPTAETPAPTQTAAPSATPSPEPSATATATPSATSTASPEPSPTPTETLQDLEIVEWAEYPYANLADPANTDTRVEILVRNPNDIPVRIDHDRDAVEFLDAAGETVYSNPGPFFYVWHGGWIRGGETFAVSVCACFWTTGLDRQPWESLRLVAPLEPAEGFTYTTDVEVILSEWFSLGGDEQATELTLVNTSGQVLISFELRVIARDENGRYVGVAISGAFIIVDSSGNTIEIQPGDSDNHLVVTEIDYFDGPLEYEVTAIGIPAGN